MLFGLCHTLAGNYDGTLVAVCSLSLCNAVRQHYELRSACGTDLLAATCIGQFTAIVNSDRPRSHTALQLRSFVCDLTVRQSETPKTNSDLSGARQSHLQRHLTQHLEQHWKPLCQQMSATV